MAKTITPTAGRQKTIGTWMRAHIVAWSLVLLTFGGSAQAQAMICQMSSPGITLPLAPIAVSVDSKPGTLLTGWTRSFGLGTCKTSSSWGDLEVIYTGSGQRILERLVDEGPGGTNDRIVVVSTDVPGIGMALATRIYFSDDASDSKLNDAPESDWPRLSYAPGDRGNFATNRSRFVSAELYIALVRTAGPLRSGKVKLDEVMRMGSASSDLATKVAVKVVAGPSIEQMGCYLRPETNVDMGSVSINEFRGIGSRAQVRHLNLYYVCSHTTKVALRFDPVTPALDPNSSVIALDGGAGAATGVGLQLLTNQMNPLPLGTPINIDIPNGAAIEGAGFGMAARYIQTEGRVASGAANASLQVTLTYE